MARWDPWSDLFNLQNEMARWVNEAFSGTPLLTSGSGRGTTTVAPTAYLPLDIRQTDREFLVEASIPGFSPQEVEITADQGILTLRGERKADGTQAEGTYLRRERANYSFVRQLTLPADVKEDEIRATFQNGVLTVHLPRVEAPAPRRIPVATGEQPEPQVLEAPASQS
jgi:HSP20 family protein